MKLRKLTILTLILLQGASCVLMAQRTKNFPRLSGPYLGQTLPGTTPEVFAPGIVSDASWAEHCQMAISPDGTEIFWSAWSSQYPPANKDYGSNTEQIYFSKIENGYWTKPALAPFVTDHLTTGNGGPVFSLDGNKLYFYSIDRPGGLGKKDTWVVERTAHGWSDPVNVGEPYNSADHLDNTPIFTNCNTAYDSGIKFTVKDGLFSDPQRVVFHPDLMPRWATYVSPDEAYAILAASHHSGYGDLDLYICFKKDDGSWSCPVNMGEKINTAKRERFPMVSPDGKYFFFMRHTETQDFFWVSTSIFDELKEKSFTPGYKLKRE